MNVCPDERSPIIGKNAERGGGGEKITSRKVETHERVERPVLRVVVVVMIVRPAKRKGLEVSSVHQFGIVSDLRSPLVKC